MKTESASVLSELKAMSSGLTTDPPGGQTTIVIEEKAVPVADFATELAGYAGLYQAVFDAEQALAVALAARDAGAPHAVARLGAGRAALKGAMGRRNPKLRTYGITPDKETTPLTAEQQVAKNAKAKATRALRHPTGTK